MKGNEELNERVKSQMGIESIKSQSFQENLTHVVYLRNLNSNHTVFERSLVGEEKNFSLSSSH
jgi:hypothetical protein